MNHLPSRVQTSVAAILLCCLTNAQANDSKSVKVDIQQQPVLGALKELGEQTGLQLLMRVDTVSTDGIVVQPVSGQLSVKAALDKLLANTGLTYEFVNDRTIRISRAVKPTSSTWREDSENDRFRVAQIADTARLVTHGSSRQDPSESQAVTTEEEGGGSKSSRMEEVLVTAQKREENLQDVPISISVLSGEKLDRSSVDVSEELSRVPGVSIAVEPRGGGTQLVMRGVTASAPLFQGSSPVAYYLDSVPFAFVRTAIVPDSNAFDLERIEVLRGPQGTLYGASALNGVVRVLTQGANLNEFELKARTSYSSTEDGGDNYRGDMAVNVPLIPGKLGARLVGGYESLGGWIDKPNQNDANDTIVRNARLKLDAQPTEALSVGMSAWISRADSGAPSRATDARQSPFATDEAMPTDYDAYGLKVGYEFSAVSLTSMSGYLDYENKGWLANNAALATFTALDAKVFSQEVVLNSKNLHAWRWSVGGMFRDAEDRLFQNLSLPGIIPAPIDFTSKSKSTAVFGEVTRIFLDGRLELTAGLRHFEDNVTSHENVKGTGRATDPLINTERDFTANSPRAILTWYPTDGLTLYTSYAEGFRSGYDQTPGVLTSNPTFPPVKADTLKNYEVGAKGTVLGGRLAYDTAVYYIDWQDVMQTVGVPFGTGGTFITATINGTSASGAGVDFGLTARPIAGLSLGVSFGWNDLKLDDAVFSGVSKLFDKGDRLNYSPEYTVGASADYAFQLGQSGYRGRFSASGNYSAKRDNRVLLGGVLQVLTSDPLMIARTSFSVDAPSNWSATLYVDNVTNEQGVVAQKSPALVDGLRIRPRTIGAQFEYRFARE